MKIKRSKGSASMILIAFVVSSLLTSVLGFRQVERLTTTPGWVASSNFSVGQTITAKMLKRTRVKSDDGAVTEPRILLGKTLSSNKTQGEPFYLSDLSQPQKTWLADGIPEGRVLYTLAPRIGSIPHTQLRNGDRIDVLVKGTRGVRTVARDVLLMGALNGGSTKTVPKGRSLVTSLAMKPAPAGEPRGTPLVIAVSPEDVYPLAGIGDNEAVTLVLHGQTERRKGTRLQIEPVASSRRQIEVYNGLSRKAVTIRI